MGRVFLLPIFKQEAKHLSHLSPCQPLPDVNWGRGREMKDSLDTAAVQGPRATQPRARSTVGWLPAGSLLGRAGGSSLHRAAIRSKVPTPSLCYPLGPDKPLTCLLSPSSPCTGPARAQTPAAGCPGVSELLRPPRSLHSDSSSSPYDQGPVWPWGRGVASGSSPPC